MSIALLAFGTLIALFAMSRLQEARSVAGWDTAAAAIVVSEINSVGSGRDEVFVPRVVYEYNAFGEDITSERISRDDQPFDTPTEAWRVANRYPVGSEAKVSFNPKKPTYSLLESKPSTIGLLFLGVGFVFGGIGVSGIFISLSRGS